MLIAIDYDHTFTSDPGLFARWASLATARGHEVVCVTMRYPREPVTDFPGEVIYTSRCSKGAHMAALERRVDIWVDDMPEFILNDAWVPES